MNTQSLLGAKHLVRYFYFRSLVSKHHKTLSAERVSPFQQCIRRASSHNGTPRTSPKLVRKDDAGELNQLYDFFYGFLSAAFLVLGLTFCFVPLYKLYCSPLAVGFDAKFTGRNKLQGDEASVVKNKHTDAQKRKRRIITVQLQGDAGLGMPIAFIPLQKSVDVLVGEPCLAFFAAYNKTDKVLHGISTYNINPHEAMSYLNKIQCFCFEEQRFKAHELVEMPVFFYFQEEMLEDPLMDTVQEMVLSYTFFNLQKNNEIVRNF